MKKYFISYITNSGMTVLNHLIEGKSLGDAMLEEGINDYRIILSVVPVPIPA